MTSPAPEMTSICAPIGTPLATMKRNSSIFGTK